MGNTGMVIAAVAGLSCCVVVVIAAAVLVFKFKDDLMGGGSGVNPNQTNESTDPNKFVSGTQSDGSKIYACQANGKFEGVDRLVGKTWDGYDKCDLTWGGKTTSTKDYVVIRPQKPYKWVERTQLEANKSLHNSVAGYPSSKGNNPFASRVCRADVAGGFKHIGRALTYTDTWKLFPPPAGQVADVKCMVASLDGKTEQSFPVFDYAVYTS